MTNKRILTPRNASSHRLRMVVHGILNDPKWKPLRLEILRWELMGFPLDEDSVGFSNMRSRLMNRAVTRNDVTLSMAEAIIYRVMRKQSNLHEKRISQDQSGSAAP